MKLLTTEQLRAVVEWWGVNDFDTVVKRYDEPREREVLTGVHKLITAECREHGFESYEDAVKQLLKEGE